VSEDDNFKSDSDSMVFRLVASTIPKWRKFKLLRWVQILKLLVDLGKIVHEDCNIEVTDTPC
jgi:hypothetical protein